MSKRFFRKSANQAQSDDAAAPIVTSMFLLPFVFFFMISAIDVGLFFSNEAHINNAARNASNVSATLGGVGNCETIFERESSYPSRASQSDLNKMSGRVFDSPCGNGSRNIGNTPEYLLVQELDNSSSLYRVELEGVDCRMDNRNPGSGEFSRNHTAFQVGDTPWCNVEWSYDGLPLSAWGLVQVRDDDGNIVPRSTTASAASDVITAGGSTGDNARTIPRG